MDFKELKEAMGQPLHGGVVPDTHHYRKMVFDGLHGVLEFLEEQAETIEGQAARISALEAAAQEAKEAAPAPPKTFTSKKNRGR